MNDASKGLDFFDGGGAEISDNSSLLGVGQHQISTPIGAPSNDDSGALGFLSGAMRQAKHPTVAAFHMAFKSLALFVYMFGSWFSSNDVFLFVVIILLLACDFWTVKNVSGRLLVGLRWWNNVKDDGQNQWIFESLDDMSTIGAMDSRIFWSGLYCTPVIWVVFFCVSFLKFQFEWTVMCAVAITLSWANIYGYTQCSKEAKKQTSSGRRLCGEALSSGFFCLWKWSGGGYGRWFSQHIGWFCYD